MKSYLMHHGILGQKWGVRRFENPDGTLTEAGKKRYYRSVGSGEKVSIKEQKSFFGNKPTGSYAIFDKNNNKVGDAIVDDEGDTDHLDWIGIYDKYKRLGYGQEALDIIIKDSIDKGKKYLTLEAAGLDPAARHIYEKKGFEVIKSLPNELWNGLVVMRKDLTK